MRRQLVTASATATAERMSNARPYPLPGFGSWLYLAVWLAIFVQAVRMYAGRSSLFWPTTSAILLALPLTGVARKLRYRAMRPDARTLAGGAPILRTRVRVIGLGMVLIVIGASAAADGSAPFGIPVTGACGVVLILWSAIGPRPAGSLALRPSGLKEYRRRWSYDIDWDDIARVGLKYHAAEPLMLLWLTRSEAPRVAPPEDVRRFARFSLKCANAHGAPIAIRPLDYGLDLPTLVAATERYANEPAARAELAGAPA